MIDANDKLVTATTKPNFSFVEPFFPPHEGEMLLIHNQHRSFYQTAAEYIAEDDARDENVRYLAWVSPEEKQKSIATDEVWLLQWYPHTPISSYVLAASNLDVLLKAAREVKP